MSIATLARKSRAQRGASTRTGWTLATTKSGNCPGPCGGGAPAKQHSFRRLMKNKARPGVEQETTAPCCTRTQRVEGTWDNDSPGTAGHVFNQWNSDTNVNIYGTLLEAAHGYGIFEMSDCNSAFALSPPGSIIINIADYTVVLNVASVSPPVDTIAPCDCCPPVATWKKTNDPKGEQSIGYYLWRKKQLTHNCIKHCIPHREHYNEHQIYVRAAGHIPHALADIDVDLKNLSGTYTYVPGGDLGPQWLGRAWSNGTWQLQGALATLDHFWGVVATQWWMIVTISARRSGEVYAYLPAFYADPAASSVAHAPPESGWTAFPGDPGHPMPPVTGTMSIDYVEVGIPCPHAACDNVGCKCNCNKSMGGTACCVVHKTMLPLSNSENIAWVVEDRTCLQTSKPDPRNPNTC